MRLRRLAPPLVLIAASVGFQTEALARFEGNVNLFVGEKWLNTGDWTPVQEQPELAVMLAFGQERSPIYFAIDVLASQKKSTLESPVYGTVDVKGATREYDVGVRKVWNAGATHPFLGAGGCLIVSRLELDAPAYGANYGDQDFGLWIDGGVTWRIGGHFNLGFDVRFSKATATFDTEPLPIDVEVGGFHAGLLLGYGW